MTRILIQSLAIVALASTLSVGDKATDVVRGPVDPYEAGYERSRFLSAAGVDSELDENEFSANKKADKPFARAFDSWQTLKAFDANRSNSIDWFEADKYRKAMRAAVLRQFDKDKNNRLGDAERVDANKLLAAGRTPRLALPGNANQQATPQGTQGGVANQRIQWDKDGDGKFSDEERAIYQKEMKDRYAKMQAENVRKYDTDGDGKVSGDEWKVANAERMKAWREKNPEAAARYDKQRETYKKQQEERLAKYDENGDGKLSGDEWKAIQKDQMEAWKEKNPEAYAQYKKRQQDYIDKHDTDGDGELSNDERQAANAKQRESYRKQQAERIAKFDKNGDGKLNREESEASRKAWLDDWKTKNPEAAKRYEENRKKWQQNGQNFQGRGIQGVPLQRQGAGGAAFVPLQPGSRVIRINPNQNQRQDGDKN